MSSFFQQQQQGEQAIQLPDESRQQQRTSPWAAGFACCIPLKSGMIQLPDDSDEEQEQLLRSDTNPFERAMPTTSFSNESDVHLADGSLPIKQDATEELADIARFSRSQYADVPDWTEMYSDEEEESAPGYVINEEIGESSFTSNNTTLHEEQQELVSFSKTDQYITDEIPSHELVDTKIPEIESEEDSFNDEQVRKEEENTAVLSSLSQEEIVDVDGEVEEVVVEEESAKEEVVVANSENEPITNEDPTAEINSQAPVTDTEAEVTVDTKEEHVINQEPIIKQDEIIIDEGNSKDSVNTNEETSNDSENKKEKQSTTDTKTEDIETQDKDSINTNANIESLPTAEQPTATKNNIEQEEEETARNNRRSSVVATAAQSILGDKLDDFTEKLAFIKKNIIMSVDSDEEYDDDDNNVIAARKENIKQQNRRSVSSVQSDTFSLFGGTKQSDTATAATKTGHRRASSLMDVAPSIARFMNQIGNDNEINTTNSTSFNANNSQNNRTFSPSSLFSSFAGPMPESSSNLKRKESITTLKEVPNEEDEELFDFTKVIEIGKNVRSFSEDIVGNGFRMFNDVANRMKTSVEQQDKKNENISAEDEWMHNYL
ncbi:hypothetical protein K501DRAFT_329628 [Backusella circina FSU 941]|nr:hypothetical protein K501DRAFT_329628 [Backusella circina FSU 941]